jgi:hypothetical protein
VERLESFEEKFKWCGFEVNDFDESLELFEEL